MGHSSNSNPPSIVWYRRELRLSDHPALAAAVARGAPIIPLYIWAPGEESPWQPGGAGRFWLHQSLAALSDSLGNLKSRLLIRQGPSIDTLLAVVKETGATHVYWNRLYDPSTIARDKAIKSALDERGVEVKTFNASLLFEPWTIQNQSGAHYKVFTPYYMACLKGKEPAAPIDAAKTILAPSKWPKSETLSALKLEPRIKWAEGIRASWDFGEAGAQNALDRFLNEAVHDYKKRRDFPAESAVSRMSPYLHFGEISPRQIWHTTQSCAAANPETHAGAESFLREICWREFSHHLLYHEPQTTDAPLREEFAGFPWQDDPEALERWQKGMTGYPIVDAGMRELWETGWMHNRVRMIAASFLVKDLLIPWQEGARWFWDTLVDADLANNTMGWQWTAGCGADAAPYFRIFNPISQGEKFDPDGVYIRRWIPELAHLPNQALHKPWEAESELLDERVGERYPDPIVDHQEARKRALAAYEQIRK